MTGDTSRPLDVFIVAGEESGDALAAGMMAQISALHPGPVRFRGVGGPRMQRAGLDSLFPMDDITAMGFAQVFAGIIRIVRRLRQTVEAIDAAPPDILVLVDSPDFTHRVAKRVRARLPHLPIVKYVAPTVWVWREGRAKAMRPHVDHVLALLPFEPQVMAQLGGPPTSYVGHPLLDSLDQLRPDSAEAARRSADPPVLLVLPGSRRTELARLGELFGEVLGRLKAGGQDFEPVLPTLPRREAEVRALVARWPVQPRIVVDEAGKRAAFRSARAALAASGTVTLELALATVPMVAAYRVPTLEGWLAPYFIKVPSAILPNIILNEQVVPEYLQWHIDAGRMAASLAAILTDGPARQAQIDAFARLDDALGLDGDPPSRRAAAIVLDLADKRRK